MPDHREVLKQPRPDQERIIDRLLSLKSLLREKTSAKKIAAGELGVPPKTADKSLLVATWNIRELGANHKAGKRLPESFHYIAEIIAAFDLVAVQEVNEDLEDFHRVMSILGGNWGYLLTDTTLGRSGNYERSAFIYDRRKLQFDGFASHVIIPPEKKVGKKTLMPLQLARTPFVAGFRSGDFRFTICSVHIYYGTDRPLDPRRVQEIEALATILAARVKAEHAWAPTVVVGDFNIFNAADATAKQLTDAGFYLPPQIATLEANENGKHFNQIALMSP